MNRRIATLALALLCGVEGQAGEILFVSVETGERDAARAPEQQNLLDTMDVYALSAHAERLRFPHMVKADALAATPNAPIIFDGWRAAFERAGAQHGVDPDLIAAVARVESGWRTDAVSPKGARGAMQLMPETARELGVTDPFDANANIEAGTRYLKAQLLRFDSVEEALAAYNAGPGNVVKHGGVPPFAETQAFVRRVMRHWQGR